MSFRPSLRGPVRRGRVAATVRAGTIALPREDVQRRRRAPSPDRLSLTEF